MNDLTSTSIYIFPNLLSFVGWCGVLVDEDTVSQASGSTCDTGAIEAWQTHGAPEDDLRRR